MLAEAEKYFPRKVDDAEYVLPTSGVRRFSVVIAPQPENAVESIAVTAEPIVTF